VKLLSRFVLLSAAVLFLGVGAAKADSSQPLYFDLTDPLGLNVTFELASKPTIAPGNSSSCGFTVTPIDLTINGVASSDFLAFYSNSCQGAFAALIDDDDFDFSLFGDKLYSGNPSKPTFSPTSPSGVNLNDGMDDAVIYNLTISPVATPEPSSLLLLGMVLLPLGMAAKRLL
jgi:hypothetical protein